MNKQDVLGTEKVTSLLIKFSVPAIIGMLVNAMYNIVDRIFIGHIPKVGNVAITGVGITLPIMTIILGFGMLIGIGCATTISIRLGQGKRKEAEQILGNAVTLIIITSIIISVVGTIFGEHILRAFGASDETLPYAKDFMTIIFYGTIVNMLGFGLNHSIRADGSPKTAMISMLIGAGTNTILEPIFIFGLGMGVKGGATATVIAQTCSAAWGLWYFTKGKSSLKIKLQNCKLKRNLVLSILAIGVSPFSMQIAASVVQVISNNALKVHGGDMAIGAMTIITSVSTIFLMPIFGLNQGSQPIVGYNYGAKKYDRVKLTIKYPQIVATTIALIGFILIELCPWLIVKAFNNDPELLNITSTGMRIYLCMLPFIGLQVIRTNYFQCIGKVKISMFLSLLRQVILLIPLLIILPQIWGLTGVWIAGPTSDFLSFVITTIMFRKDMHRLEAVHKAEESLQSKSIV